uniref:Uncharacterized protein n=1 Tax=Romanomermis culicivorax TaxID=13658 RepID=A0A915KPA9_ROMCU
MNMPQQSNPRKTRTYLEKLTNPTFEKEEDKDDLSIKGVRTCWYNGHLSDY